MNVKATLVGALILSVLGLTGSADHPAAAAGASTEHAFANAPAEATGVRLRELPFTRERIKASVAI